MSVPFARLGLPEALVRVLSSQGITETFPIQEATIPDALGGRDVSGRAPTGSGKTLAFGLPMLSRVDESLRNRPAALVLAPTRELAEQIKEELAPLARAVRRTVFAVYGGVGYGPQIGALRKGVDVLVATPGRLEDLIEQGVVALGDASIVVIDEADRMADMGFLPAVRRILDRTARRRQTLMFSATLDGDVAVLSRDYQTEPVLHQAASVETEAADADHHFWLVGHEDRIGTAAAVITRTGRSIVFTRTRHGADRLARQLGNLGVEAVAMHGGRSQHQRTRSLHAFSTGGAQALIATDVAARGIHVDAVASVVHFDPPEDAKDYLHRSGRTARAGATGTVVTLVTPEQRAAVRRMQRDLAINAPIEPPRPESLPDGNQAAAGGAARPGHSRLSTARTPMPQGRPNPGAPDRTARRDRPAERPAAPAPAGAAERGPSVYVANLPWDATDDDLHDLFGRYGFVRQATVIVDRRTGRSKGYGFVDMPQPAARAAIDRLHGASMQGRDLTVRFAQPRTWGD